MDWIYLTQDRDQWRALVSTVMDVRVPLNAGNFLSGCTIGTFSRRAQLRERVSHFSPYSRHVSTVYGHYQVSSLC
jgi:hypothetical protein